MSNPRHALSSLLRRLGVARSARVRGVAGTGASAVGRGSAASKLTLVGMVAAFALLGALCFSAAAFAASPEPPELHAEPVFATSATLDGVLNPHSTPSEAGTYQFVYRKQTTTGEDRCKGTGETKAPAAPAAGNGTEHEVLPPEVVKGLEASTEYAACLVAKNTEGEATSSAVSFTTSAAGAQEIPEVSSIEDTTAVVTTPSTEALLHGVVNPAGTGEAGTYRFLYKKSTTKTCTGESETTEGMILTPLREEPGQAISSLAAGTEYAVCLRVENYAKTEMQTSPAVTFTTPVKPEKPKTEAVTGETATTAVLHGELNPAASGEVETGYHFAYNTGATCTGSSEAGGEGVVKVEPKTKVSTELTNLDPHQKYKVCLVATNTAGEAVPGNEVSFETLALAPVIVVGSESASEVKATEATLHATIDPENQETKYQFEYSTKATGETLEGTIVKVPSTPGVIPAAVEEHAVEVPTEALTPHTTYYYRVVAANAKGEKATPGKVQSFTTGPLETPTHLEAKPIAATTATLNGVLNPAGAVGAGSYEFLYKQSTTECEAGETLGGPALGAMREPVKAPLTGLLPDTAYTFCLRAHHETEAQTSAPISFRTLPEAYVAGVSSTSATFHAVLDPEGGTTTYRFEYGTGTPYSSQTAQALAEGSARVNVEAHVQNLAAGTTYHYRVVATNAAHETIESEDQTFTTQAGVGSNNNFTLPDGRQYEMVSPPQKNGAKILHGGGIEEAAAAGGAITYLTKIPTETGPAGFAEDSQVLSTRTPSGWVTRDLAVPHELTPGAPFAAGKEYRHFSSDLSHAIVQPYGFSTPCTSPGGAPQPCLSPQASEQTAFLDTDLIEAPTSPTPVAGSLAPRTANGQPGFCAENCFQPFVTGKEPYANVPAGTVFGGQQEGAHRECEIGQNYCGPFFVAGTPDLSHVLLESDVPLTEGAPSGEGGLYEASAGKLTFVGKGESEGGAGNEGAFAGHGAHGISADGSRVIFRGKSEGPEGEPLEGLLMRETTRGETIRLGEGEFQDASADDSRVFFDTEWNGELDVFELTNAPGEPLAGRVTDLTEGQGVRGLVLGASEDGSYVYFVSEGVLAASGATKAGENLYVDHYDGSSWKPTFITALSSEDAQDWDGQIPDWGEALLQYQPVRVSPDGRWLAFMSQASLTGYDNLDARAAAPDAEVYLYHAETGGATSLTCASCNPTGARPDGISYERISSKSPEAEAGTFRAWPENGALVAANLPGSYYIQESALALSYQPRFLSDGGRLFFDSEDALVPLDTNGTEDVYEYEPEGIKSPEGKVECSASTSSGSEVFRPEHAFKAEGVEGHEAAGCVALISSGNSSEESAFLDASEGHGEGEHGEAGKEAGSDVFFLTSSKLSPQDQDTAYDVYDAHECTSASPCISPVTTTPPCETEASCKASPQPEPGIYGPPPSATFSGPGNLGGRESNQPAVVKKVTKKTVTCKKGFVKKKIKKKETCTKAKSKKTKRAKKAGHNGRTGR